MAYVDMYIPRPMCPHISARNNHILREASASLLVPTVMGNAKASTSGNEQQCGSHAFPFINQALYNLADVVSPEATINTMGFVIFLIIVGVIAYFWLSQDSPEVKKRGKNRTADQKTALRYFLNEGCMRKKPSDEDYDALVAKMKTEKHLGDMQVALEKLGIDESEVTEVKPIHLEGYLFGDKNSYSKVGKDGVVRSSKYQASWIFCSATHVYLYQYTFNTDEDGKKIATEEYCYKDITNFSTSSDTVETPFWDPKKKETFLKNVDSTRFRITVPGDSLYCVMAQTDENEAAVRGLKAKLRDKKTN